MAWSPCTRPGHQRHVHVVDLILAVLTRRKASAPRCRIDHIDIIDRGRVHSNTFACPVVIFGFSVPGGGPSALWLKTGPSEVPEARRGSIQRASTLSAYFSVHSPLNAVSFVAVPPFQTRSQGRLRTHRVNTSTEKSLARVTQFPVGNQGNQQGGYRRFRFPGGRGSGNGF